MIFLWPLTLCVVGAVAWLRRGSAAGKGSWWFLGWSFAGFLMTFSFVSGFTIGIFILPLAAVAVLVMAYRSPHLIEMSGFLAGIGATALLLVAILLR